MSNTAFARQGVVELLAEAAHFLANAVVLVGEGVVHDGRESIRLGCAMELPRLGAVHPELPQSGERVHSKSA